ncbi:TPA: hypothetical protein GRR52_14485 [Vibrio parahaemolyticus]|nr:hypothetical protein [Vibrio parahaemolyticus]
MTRELRVRSQLVNPETGRFIKAIDERDLSDFLGLIAPNSGVGTLIIPDLTPAILEVKSHVENLLEIKEKKELSVTHSAVFNLWNKAKISKKESVKEKLNINVITESEKALNLIHTRLPALERAYLSPESNMYDWGYEREVDRALDSLLSEVQVFIEIVLCHIHASAIIDPALIEEPSIVGHCHSIYFLLEKWLRKEADVSQKYKSNETSICDESFIYQCCIENNIGLNPSALLSFLGVPETQFDVLSTLISSVTNEDRYNQRNDSYSVRKMEWRKADSNKVERARKIIKLMQQLMGVLSLFEAVENNEVEYASSSEIFDEIKTLIDKET